MCVYGLSRLKGSKGEEAEKGEDDEIVSEDRPEKVLPEDDDFQPGQFSRSQPVSDAEKIIASNRSAKKHKKKKTSEDKDDVGYFASTKERSSKNITGPCC